MSASFSVFATISSILAGWILQSSINFSNDFFAIYLLNKSKAEIKTVSGVSSIIKATHAAFSKVVIFLHSFHISFHFISSEGISIKVVVTSLVTSQAYCWIDFKIISFAISCFSSSNLFLYFFITPIPSSAYFVFISSKNNLRASFSDKLDISDNLPSNSFIFSLIRTFSSFNNSSFEFKISNLFSICSNLLSIFSSLSKILSSVFSAFLIISKLSFFAVPIKYSFLDSAFLIISSDKDVAFVFFLFSNHENQTKARDIQRITQIIRFIYIILFLLTSINIFYIKNLGIIK